MEVATNLHKATAAAETAKPSETKLSFNSEEQPGDNTEQGEAKDEEEVA